MNNIPSRPPQNIKPYTNPTPGPVVYGGKN